MLEMSTLGMVVVMDKAKIIEIFSSIQGEGLHLGQEQTFVRFLGCNLKCSYCDERKKTKYREYKPSELIDAIIRENKKVVSLTGGEPLLHAGFLKQALPKLKKRGFVIYLETNGTLKNKLLEIIDFLDIISMDIKLPSSTRDRACWKGHLDFLKQASKKKVFVKAVITNKTTSSDIKKAVSIIERIDRNIFFILQPATLKNRIQKIKRLEEFLSIACSGLNNVRFIPQVHKILGIR